MGRIFQKRVMAGSMALLAFGLAALLLTLWGVTASPRPVRADEDTRGGAVHAAAEAPQTTVNAPAQIPATVYYAPQIHGYDPNPPTATPQIIPTRGPSGEPVITNTPDPLATRGSASATPYVSKVTPRPTATATAGPSPTPVNTPTAGPSPTPSPTLTPRPETKFGIETANIVKSGQPMFDAGSTWTRRNAIAWFDVEPNEGERRWSALASLDQELIKAAQLQLKVILIIRGVPAWAQETPGSFCGPMAEDKMDDYATFAYEVVQRYSAPPYNVRYYELGNEPDVLTNQNGDWWFGCWADRADRQYRGGQKYAKMLKAVYPEIKAANPNAQVVVGGMLADCDPQRPNNLDCSYTRFFEGIMIGGGGPFFDVVSFHTYDFYYQTPGTWGNNNWNSGYDTLGPSVVAKSRYYRSVLQQYGFSNKVLIDTEAALLCWMCPYRQDYETAKSWYIPELYATSLAEGVITLWYSFEGWENSGLVNSAYQPLPAMNAWKVTREKLGFASYLGPVTSIDIGSSSGVVGYKFRNGNRTVWLIRSLKSASRKITLPSKPAAVTDPVGNALPTDKEITLTLKPIFIEWNSVLESDVQAP